MSVSVCILHLQDIIDASVQFKLKEIFTFGLNLMKIVLMLKAQYISFRIQKKQRRSLMTECEWELSSSFPQPMLSDGTQAEIMFMDELM